MISMIAAIDEQFAIGCNNRLLAYLPNDLKYFKRVTSGHPVIMGRNTFESLPVKPLPGRKNIVVSTTLAIAADGCVPARSVEEALEQVPSGEECFVIGGMQLYRQMMPLADKLYITRIRYRFEADAFFPDILPSIWRLQSSERHKADTQHAFAYTFEVYLKRKK